MLSITHSAQESRRITPHILPCCIEHTGPVEIEPRLWAPRGERILHARTELDPISTNIDSNSQSQSESNVITSETTPVVYFRGRRLLGRTSDLPAGYKGIILSGEKTPLSQTQAPGAPAATQKEAESLFARIARRDVETEGFADEDDDIRMYDTNGDCLPLPGNGNEVDSEMEADAVPIETMQVVGRFQDFTVWEHDVLPGVDEVFTRGVGEWLDFARVVHSE